MYTVGIRKFDDFSKEEQKIWCDSDSRWRKEDAHYIVETIDDKIIAVHTDAIEPDNAFFNKDLAWISLALINAYKLGELKGESK